MFILKDLFCINIADLSLRLRTLLLIMKVFGLVWGHNLKNSIRRMAIGRKNYLFCGNHNSAENAAIMHSLIETCIARDVDPREWLTDVPKESPHIIMITVLTWQTFYLITGRNPGSVNLLKYGIESDELSILSGAYSFIHIFFFFANRQRRIGGVATTSRSWITH